MLEIFVASLGKFADALATCLSLSCVQCWLSSLYVSFHASRSRFPDGLTSFAQLLVVPLLVLSDRGTTDYTLRLAQRLTCKRRHEMIACCTGSACRTCSSLEESESSLPVEQQIFAKPIENSDHLRVLFSSPLPLPTVPPSS